MKDVQLYQALSLLVSAAFLVTALLGRTNAKTPPNQWERPVFWAGLTAFTVFQLQFLPQAFGNYFTYDEFGFARAYSVFIGEGKPAYGGLNQGLAGLVYSVWYRLAGYSFQNARQLSTLIGAAGAAATYFAFRREWGERTAMLTALFLRLSGFYFLFTSVALEVSFSFLVIPLAAIALPRGSSGFWRQLFSGAFLAISIFTYPGVLLVYFSVVAALLTLHRKKVIPWFWNHLALILGAFVVLDLVVLAHYFYFLPGIGHGSRPGFLQGGGRLTLDPYALWDSLQLNFTDLLVGGRSWYLDFVPHSTYLEMGLWGAFGMGCRQLWKEKKRLLPLVIFYVFVLNLFISQSPGLRRLAAVLPLAVLVCAFGFQQVRKSWLLGVTFALLLWNSLWLTPSLLAKPLPPQESFPPGFPDSIMRSSLKRGNVFVDEEEVYLWFMQDALLAQRELIQQSESAPVGHIYFKRREAPLEECLFYVTWRTIGPAMRPSLGPIESERLSESGSPDFSRVTFLDSRERLTRCRLQ